MSNTDTTTTEALPGLPVVTHPLAEMVKVDPKDTSCCCPSRPRVAMLLSLDHEHPILFCGHHAQANAETIRGSLAWRYV